MVEYFPVTKGAQTDKDDSVAEEEDYTAEYILDNYTLAENAVDFSWKSGATSPVVNQICVSGEQMNGVSNPIHL